MRTPHRSKNGKDAWQIPSRSQRHSRRRNFLFDQQDASLDQALGRLRVGDQIKSRFEILEKLGTGGMSIVYRAKDHQHDIEVALKFISPALLQDPRAIKQMIQEAKISSSLAHPHIVKVYELHHEQGLYFFHMELFEGQTLREWFNRRKKENRPVTLFEVSTLLASLCDALAYAHQSTIHRDLKPENIGLENLKNVKLMDFGLAQFMRQSSSSLFHETITQISAGTPYYMAPELITQDHGIDGRADQFSLAVMIYELLTGDLPLGLSASLTTHRPDLPLRFSRAIDRALSQHPEQRFPTIRAFAEEIAVASQPETLPTRLYRKIYQAPTRLKQISAICLMAAASYPIASLIHQHVQQRSDQIQSAYAAQAVAQEEADQIQQKVLALRMESDVFSRQLAIEAAAISPETKKAGGQEPQAEWLSVSNAWHSAAQLRHWLESRTDADGHWLLLNDTLNGSRQEIDQDRLQASLSLLNIFKEQAGKVRALLDHSRQMFELRDNIHRFRSQTESIKKEESIPGIDLSTTPWQEPTIENWRDVLALLNTESQQRLMQLDAEKQRALTAYHNAQRQWTQLFPSKLGAPDLTFIFDATREHQQALAYFEAGEYKVGLQIISKATEVLKRWSHQVTEARAQCAPAWNNAPYRFEALGMRFARSGSAYWSIWELRIMDFARWLAFNPEISDLVLNGLPLSVEDTNPTQPLTGLDRRTARYIAAWVGDQLVELGRPIGTLPNSQLWQELWTNESLPGPYRFGIVPQENPERTIVLRDYYLDTEIDMSTYLRAAAAGAASPSGLFNLTDNAWEWSDSELELERSNSPNGEPLKWMVYGGGTFGALRFHQHEPPFPNTVYVERREAIGMRLVIEPNVTLDRYTGYKQ